MDLHQLDFAFPFFVFGYGILMLAVLNNRRIAQVAEQRLTTELWSSLQSKKLLAYVCFFVGGLWSLQNLWL